MAAIGSLKAFVDNVLRALDLEVRRYHKVETQREAARLDRIKAEYRSLVLACERHGIDLMLDVGANAGQFVRTLRIAGYDGRVVSFEPLPTAHAELRRHAQADPKWTVAERMAIGEATREIEINVAQNLFSSSLLPMTERHLQGAPHSGYVGKATAPMMTLDHYWATAMPDEKGPVGLKIDAQGYEGFILDGLIKYLPRVGLIFAEMSLVPLYTGAPSFIELYTRICRAGFRCASIRDAFTDPRTAEMLAVDGLFVRDTVNK